MQINQVPGLRGGKGLANSRITATDLIDQINGQHFILLRLPILPVRDLIDTEGVSEICVRWVPEESSNTPTGAFLMMIEESGLMALIDKWLIRCVCRVIKSDDKLPWSLKRKKLYSISLSEQSIIKMDLASFLSKVIEYERIKGDQLVISVPLELALKHERNFCLMASSIRRHGCQVSLSGMPSMDHLIWSRKAVGARYIKLDFSGRRLSEETDLFMKNLESLARSSAALQITLVAEFMGGPRLIPQLMSLGIEYVQGFSLSQPSLIDSRFGLSPFSFGNEIQFS